jgi:hypothetical protein
MPWEGVCKAGGCTLCRYPERVVKVCVGGVGRGGRGGGIVACCARAMVCEAYWIGVSCVCIIVVSCVCIICFRRLFHCLQFWDWY